MECQWLENEVVVGRRTRDGCITGSSNSMHTALKSTRDFAPGSPGGGAGEEGCGDRLSQAVRTGVAQEWWQPGPCQEQPQCRVPVPASSVPGSG